VLDDVPRLEQDVFQHHLPLRLPAGQEFKRHREVLELLLLGILHDRFRLSIALERHALLVPTDRLSLLLQRRGHASKGPRFLA